MNTKEKTVSNLLVDIGKCRDLIAEGNLDKIHSKLQLFLRVKYEIVKHCCKYIDSPAHELDFNEHDLGELGQEIYDYVKNFQQKFLYSKFHKMAMDNAPVDDEVFQKLSTQIGKEMRVDTTLREVYKTLSYFGIVIHLWSQLPSRKSFSDQITDCIRSFL